ncbi:MAG: hypothetical protein ACE5QF_00470 [Thermoplasmata archaeon]
MKGDSENPFENRPIQDEPSFEENPFENVPSSVEEIENLEDIPILADEFDRSKLALVSGIGFVGLAIFFYFFVIQVWETTQFILSLAALVVSALVALFYLLDDLTIRPKSMTERGAHFLAGIFLGTLVLLIIATALTFRSDILKAFPVFIIMILTNASVALFLYSMMWEE